MHSPSRTASLLRRIPALALGALLCFAAPGALADVITRTFTISGTNFSPADGPVETASASFTVTWDTSRDHTDDTTGITQNRNNVVAGGTLAFSYLAAYDRLTIGTLINGAGAIGANTNDFLFDLVTASGPSPSLNGCIYSVVTKGSLFSANNQSVVPGPEPAAAPKRAAALYGLSRPNTMILFDPTGASSATETLSITGVADGEHLAALDTEPVHGTLLAFGVDDANNRGTLYKLDPTLGTVTAIGPPGSVAFVDENGAAVDLLPGLGSIYDMDVDPVTGHVRVVNLDGLNFRIDLATGLPVDGDNGLASGGPDGVNPDGRIGPPGIPVGIAHTNAVAGAAATTLYSLGYHRQLHLQAPPNNGQNTFLRSLLVQGAPMSTDLQVAGLDLPPEVAVSTSDTEAAAGEGYILVEEHGMSSRVARVDLATGEVTFTATLPAGEYYRGLALLPQPPRVSGPTRSALTYRSVTLGGNVAGGGGAAITERGVLISRTSDNNDPQLGGPNVTRVTAGIAAVSEFTVPVSGLTEQTQYSYRAYATNAIGTTYTPAHTFTTPKEIDFAGVNDQAIISRGLTRIYPLANDVSPSGVPLRLLSVSNPAIVIDGNSLIIPAKFAGTFTYKFSDGLQTGQASVTVNRVVAGSGAQNYSGVLRNGSGAIAGSAEVTFTATRRSATVLLKMGTSTVRRVVLPIAGGTTYVRTTAVDIVTLTDHQDGTVTAQVTAPGWSRSGVLQVRQAASGSARYNVALASVETAIPGGGFAMLSILANARATVAAVLPDGTTFSTATWLRENGTIALYSTVGAGVNPRALVGGELVLANLATSDLTGEWAWVKPPQRRGIRGLHLGGVDTQLTAIGSRYQGQAPLAGAGTLVLTGGDLLPENASVSITAGRPAITPDSALRSWTANARFGTFLAGIKRPDAARAVQGRGVYLPKSQTVWGFFPGQAVGGRIVLSTR